MGIDEMQYTKLTTKNGDIHVHKARPEQYKH